MMVTMMMVMMMIIVIVIKMTKQFSFHQLSLSVSGEMNAEKDAIFAPVRRSRLDRVNFTPLLSSLSSCVSVFY